MSSIFLSHNHNDKPFARQLAERLKKQGVQVWIDEAEVKVGDSLIEKISRGIADFSYLGVILSPSSVSSEWVRREINLALTQEIKGKKVKVLPILYQICDIPGFLADKLYADFTEDFDDGFLQLMGRLQSNYESDPIKNPKLEGDNFINLVWDKLEPDLQDALAMAFNQSKRDGANIIKTKYFFAALAKLRPDPLSEYLGTIPKDVFSVEIEEGITTNPTLLSENPYLSFCVENSLRSLASNTFEGERLSSTDVFVDIAKYGTGSSVASLRENGITPANVDKIVEEKGWKVITR